MPPGDVYVLAIVVTSLFVAPFNGLARVVVLAWIAGHVLYLAGLMAEVPANIVGQACVLLLGFRHRHAPGNWFAWSFSIPLLAVNLCWLTGIITPFVGWWTVLIVAMVQLLVLSLAVDGEVTHDVVGVWKQHTGRGMFRIGVRA